MPDKLLACRTASLLALVLLLLTGCFISAEPLIPTVDIVTPLPVEFSAVQLDKNGKMVLPDQSKGPKAPDIEHLKLVSGRYVRDNGRPNILTFAKLDDSGTNFLLQVADASSGGSVVYAIARVSGQTLAIYGLAAPDGGPEGATKDDITGDYRFADYAHLKAAAQKYAQTAASGLIYRIASTPDEISQLKRDVDALLKPKPEPPKLDAQALPATPVAPQPADKLMRAECFPVTEANEAIGQQSGFVAATLYGSSINDVGKWVDLDNDDKVSIRLAFSIYRVGDKMRWAIFERDAPETHHPTNVCLIAAGDLRGQIEDWRSRSASMASIFTSFDNAQALKDCKTIRPDVIRAQWAAKLVDAHFDQPMSNGFHLKMLSDMLGSETLSSDLGLVIALRAAEQGDSRCNVLPALLTDGLKDHRLIAQLVGKEIFRKGVISDEEAYSFLVAGDGHWSILQTWASGATFEWAKGGRMDVNGDYFARVFDKK